MRSFLVGRGRVHSLMYAPDSPQVVVDVRGESQRHPSMGYYDFLPATELVWYDIATGTVVRRFRLRDSLYGPGGSQISLEDEALRQDSRPAQPAFDVSGCLSPLWVATVWEWTNAEDCVCLFNVADLRAVNLWVRYKTHTQKILLTPDASKLLAATINDVDDSRLFEVWETVPKQVETADSNDEDGLGLLGQQVREAHLAVQNGCADPFRKLLGLAFDGKYAVMFGDDYPGVLVWDSLRLPRKTLDQVGPAQDLDWSVTPQEGAEVKLGFVPCCAAFAPGGSSAAVGGEGLALLDATTSQARPLARRGLPVSAVTFTADGRELVCGTEDGTVEHWDRASGGLLRAYAWGYGPISAVAASPDGATCAAGTAKGYVVVWDRDGD